MRAVDALETLELLGSSQHGLVTAAQAQSASVSNVDVKRLVDAGTLVRARHGVYALPSAGVDSLQDLRAAWLAASAGGKVVVSGLSAAVVHSLGDLVPSRHEFSSSARRQSAQPDVRFRRAELPVGDVEWVGGLPVTSVSRTVADLARASLDFDHFAGVLSDAVDKRDVDMSSLERALEKYAHRHGEKSGRALLAVVAPGFVAAAVRAAVETPGALAPSFRDELLGMIEKPDGADLLLRLLREHAAA